MSTSALHPPQLPPQPATPPPPSRRELNKAATREAIARAALDFLRSRPLNTFTVDDVADAAGVSRRTFFNYFSSVEAAVASFTQNYLDQVIVELEARPLGEPLLVSAQSALSAVDSPRDLGILAETFTLTRDPQLSRFQLQAWEECSLKITEFAKHRLPPGTDALFLYALVGAVIGSCRAAFQVWFLEHGTNITAESLADLRAKLEATLTLIRNGFPN